MSNYDYLTGNSLSRVHLSLIALNLVGKRTDDKSEFELLSLDCFNQALYELLYAATCTGIEEYLQIRLSEEVFFDDASTKRYIKEYNKNVKLAKWKIPRLLFPLNEMDRETIACTLFEKQVYHRLDIMQKYFAKISQIDIAKCKNWTEVEKIIHNRHLILHHGSRTKCGDKLKITPYMVTNAYNTAKDFIDELEALFVQNGKNSIIEYPDE